jgi:hypothetical protein
MNNCFYAVRISDSATQITRELGENICILCMDLG